MNDYPKYEARYRPPQSEHEQKLVWDAARTLLDYLDQLKEQETRKRQTPTIDDILTSPATRPAHGVED